MAYLGITQTNHGSSAALYDGERLFASMEERFDRTKFSSGFPYKAMDWCLSRSGLSLSDVQGVGFYMTAGNFMRATRSSQTSSWRSYPEILYSLPSDLLRFRPFDQGEVELIHQRIQLFGKESMDVYFIDHHLAHAAASYLNSGYERCAIVCMDGNGDGHSLSVGVGNEGKIEFLQRQAFPHSLGHLYSTFTQFLGFTANSDEYKVMGLAAYGNPERFADKIRKLIRLQDDGGFELDLTYFSFHLISEPRKYNDRLIQLLSMPPNRETENVGADYKDLASAVQLVTEEVLEHVLRSVRERTGLDALCYGGGVALNCLANGKIFRRLGFQDVFIPPHPGDSGLAVGAAAYLTHCVDGRERRFLYSHDYLGPEYSVAEMEKNLKENGLNYSEPDDIVAVSAKLLAAGKVVGRFQGSSEFGPRALGNRSIMADPRSESMKEVVNAKIKFREPFRPFAPSALAEETPALFDMSGRGDLRPESPESFMLCTAQVREEWKDRLAAITHADGSARLQVVHPGTNESYHRLISTFRNETGVPAILNTSFNVRGEPIILTPRDAIRCFYSTGMDAMAMGPFLLTK